MYILIRTDKLRCTLRDFDSKVRDSENVLNLGICRAISSKLSKGALSGRSSSREGAVTVSEDMVWLLFVFDLRRSFLFSSARCRLWNRKKNIDIISVLEESLVFFSNCFICYNTDVKNLRFTATAYNNYKLWRYITFVRKCTYTSFCILISE